ncbi:biotin-independent malonate decarboxylase subunit beta [Pengzhenrongella sp.]|jgi:malonate decarboxylase beta subunit|uniref:biotin-independent malonate decarboxylase subunit beta n=1 Tax=Pengzhenrongella sp. TaxID=2888820 RepID=UPI002F92411D
MTRPTANAFTELRARERVRAVLDPGTFREILDPFAGVESPHLALQGIVPQADDGAVIGRGTIDGTSAVVLALDGGFQGGGIGEVSGAKLAASLEQAVEDNRRGIPTRAVVLLETGGIRLQEANLGLLAIAEIHSALVELRTYGPVIGIVAGTVGCFGGMGIAAGLTSHLVMTRGGRLALNGPEVIETEAGVDELDSADRAGIWAMLGGAQRVATARAEFLVDDDAAAIAAVVRQIHRDAPAETRPVRAERVEAGRRVLAALDPTTRPTPEQFRTLSIEGSL